MSGQDVETVRALVDAWNRGDLEATVAHFDPDGTIRLAGIFPGLRREYRGLGEIRQWWRDFRDPWEELTVSAERTIERDGQVLVEVRFNARGRDGLVVERSAAALCTFRDGLLIEFRTFGDWGEALEGSGLEE